MAAPGGVGMLIKKARSKLSVSNVAGGKVELNTGENQQCKDPLNIPNPTHTEDINLDPNRYSL